jgi:hypothetical protein
VTRNFFSYTGVGLRAKPDLLTLTSLHVDVTVTSPSQLVYKAQDAALSLGPQSNTSYLIGQGVTVRVGIVGIGS